MIPQRLPITRTQRCRLCLIQLLVLVLLVSDYFVLAEHPCDDQNAVYLPQKSQCIVPVKNAKDWIQAQSACERGGGSLYRLNETTGELTAYAELAACLAATPRGDGLPDDFWIGVVSQWSRHWFWINGTLLNPIQYVTGDPTALSDSKFNVCSQYLSVDYCVSVCRDDAAAYTVLHHRTAYFCCQCSFYIRDSLVYAANESYFLPDNRSLFYIAPARESNLIRLASSETFSDTETLCAVVDSNTANTRELSSQTCFSESPFLCRLTNTTDCNNPECTTVQCRFRVRDECVLSDGRRLTWFGARSVCRSLGGDLWTLGTLDDMYQVSQYLLRSTPYWLGATDHVWAFAPESNIFGKTAPDFEVVRCGHMFLERTGESSQSFEWKWAGTRCDQQKSYICQYAVTEQARFASSSSTKDNVVCPWKIPPIPTQPPVNTLVPPIHTTADTGSGMTLPALVADGGDGETGYPIAAIIAACIAALVILLCAIFMLGYSRRRKWLLEKWKRTREYLWPFWTSAPTYVTADHSHSDPGFDTLSTGHTAFHSDSGSVLLSGTLPHPSLLHESAAYKNAHAHRSTSDLKDASKRNESFEKVSRRANQSMTSSGGSAKTGGGLLRMGGMGGDGSATEGGYGGISLLSDGLTLSGGGGGGVGGGTGSLLEEHLMSASYSSLSPRAREYMTLSAHMNIHEETDSPFLGKRKKPEVALVTNDVDLNFTVNHAYARSRQGSERSSEKGLDEIDLNLGSTVEIPTRTVEESLMYY